MHLDLSDLGSLINKQHTLYYPFRSYNKLKRWFWLVLGVTSFRNVIKLWTAEAQCLNLGSLCFYSPTTLWARVCSTSETHLWKTGSAYGRKPERRAVATDERHSRSGKRSLSSSFSWFHFWISGGISMLMNSDLFRWCPTESASVPMASYRMRRFLCYRRERNDCVY